MTYQNQKMGKLFMKKRLTQYFLGQNINAKMTMKSLDITVLVA